MTEGTPLIHVDSYLRTRDGEFTPVGKAVDPPSNPRHVEGAIDLTVNGVAILDRDLWDDVDQLWAYICDMVVTLNDQDESSTFFPDQPIKLTFRRVGGNLLLVSLAYDDVKRSVSVDEASFVVALQEGGRRFFDRLRELLPENAPGYDDALERLAAYRHT